MDPALTHLVDREAGESGWTGTGALLDRNATAVIVFGEDLLAALSEILWRRGRSVPASVSVLAVRTRPGPAWAAGVAVEGVLMDPVEAGRRAVRRLQAHPSDERARVERVAPVWLEGESLASPANE